jgi:hypothetical protein
MSLRTRSQGTVRWMPLAGVIERGWAASSSARTSSANTPPALMTGVRVAIVKRSPSASTSTPSMMRPGRFATSPSALTRLAATAPSSSAAVRITVSTSRASSAAAS